MNTQTLLDRVKAQTAADPPVERTEDVDASPYFGEPPKTTIIKIGEVGIADLYMAKEKGELLRLRNPLWTPLMAEECAYVALAQRAPESVGTPYEFYEELANNRKFKGLYLECYQKFREVNPFLLGNAGSAHEADGDAEDAAPVVP